jgi:hypothetical protein
MKKSWKKRAFYTSRSGFQSWEPICGKMENSRSSIPAYFSWNYGLGLCVDRNYVWFQAHLAQPGAWCRDRKRHVREILALLPGGGILQDWNGSLDIHVRRDCLSMAVYAVRDILPRDTLVSVKNLLGTESVRVQELYLVDAVLLEPVSLPLKKLVTIKLVKQVTLAPKFVGGEERPRWLWAIDWEGDESDRDLQEPTFWYVPVGATLHDPVHSELPF